jgi:hypothetical protein
MINLANWDGKVNFSCNGSVNTSSDGIAGDCKLDTKPQPQWTSNWLGDSNRNKIYTDWSKMITMKTTEPVFLGTASISNRVLYYRILNLRIMPSTQLRRCFSVGNVTTQNVPTGFLIRNLV